MMGGPNRKMRRAMEAQARKAQNRAKQPPQPAEALVLQRMYDQRTFQLEQAQRFITQLKAALASVLVELGVDEFHVSPNTLEVLEMGVVEDVLAGPDVELGGAKVELLYAGEEGDDDDAGEEE